MRVLPGQRGDGYDLLHLRTTWTFLASAGRDAAVHLVKSSCSRSPGWGTRSKSTSRWSRLRARRPIRTPPAMIATGSGFYGCDRRLNMLSSLDFLNQVLEAFPFAIHKLQTDRVQEFPRSPS